MELIKIENGKLPETVIQTLVNFERMAKQIKDQQEELKKGILEAMERNGLLKIDNEYLTIYISEKRIAKPLIQRDSARNIRNSTMIS